MTTCASAVRRRRSWAFGRCRTPTPLDVVRNVREAMPGNSKPAARWHARQKIAYDATVYIESAIKDVLKTLSETLLIVIIVIFLFMGSLRTVIIPVVAIPISLIGAVFLMMLAALPSIFSRS